MNYIKWDFIAGLFELIGLILVGNKNKLGFIFNCLGCIIWMFLSFTTPMYGLLIVVTPGIFINIYNYIKWKKEL